jgi:hypothetical protein
MQTLKLADDLFPALDAGVKRGTIRTGKRDIEPGELFLEAASGADLSRMVRVERVSFTPASRLTDADAMLDGYTSVRDLFGALQRFYPSLAGSDLVTVIQFEQEAPPAREG